VEPCSLASSIPQPTSKSPEPKRCVQPGFPQQQPCRSNHLPKATSQITLLSLINLTRIPWLPATITYRPSHMISCGKMIAGGFRCSFRVGDSSAEQTSSRTPLHLQGSSCTDLGSQRLKSSYNKAHSEESYSTLLWNMVWIADAWQGVLA
jgi:hypothetical protein